MPKSAQARGMAAAAASVEAEVEAEAVPLVFTIEVLSDFLVMGAIAI